MASSLPPKIRPAQESKKIAAFIKATVKKAKHEKVVIASSGGIDSSVTMALAVRALDPGKVLVLKLPYNKIHPRAIRHADLIVKSLKIPKRNVFQVNIGPTTHRIWKTILIKCSTSQTGQSKLANQIRLGNIMARARMIYIYDMARSKLALACGTENRSEHLLSYYTRFGDEASDLEPIKHLYKTQVYQLADYLELPQAIIDHPPTAGLWVDQTDEEELGFSYNTADKVLYLSFDKKMSSAQVAKKIHRTTQEKSETYWKRRTKKVLDRVSESEFKHHLPYHL